MFVESDQPLAVKQKIIIFLLFSVNFSKNISLGWAIELAHIKSKLPLVYAKVF